MLITSAVTLSGCGLITNIAETGLSGIQQIISGIGVDKKPIEKAIEHIEDDELEDALEECKDMDKEVIEYGSNDILASVAEKLEYYFYFDNWTLTEEHLVDPAAIENLKLYKSILSTLTFKDDDTNADDFISAALKLEKYVEWNEYHLSNQKTYFDQAVAHIDQGKDSDDDAVAHYEKAYTVLNNAYNAFKDGKGKGMFEVSEFYSIFAEQIRDIIDGERITNSDQRAYEDAYEAYVKIVKEYATVMEQIITDLEDLPDNLYW